jgi:hypothetical protein
VVAQLRRAQARALDAGEPSIDLDPRILPRLGDVRLTQLRPGVVEGISAWCTSRSIIAAAVISSPKFSPQAEKGWLLVTVRRFVAAGDEHEHQLRGVRVKRDVGAKHTRSTSFGGNPVPQRPDLRTLRAGRDVGDPCRRVRSLIRNGY